MICEAIFNSYTTFNLKIYLTGKVEKLDEAEFCELEIKRFETAPKRLYRGKKFKNFYRKTNPNKDISRFVSLKDLHDIAKKCRVMDIEDNYNYRYLFSYSNNKLRVISRTQIKDMYFVPNKKAAYYLDTLYFKIDLNLPDKLSNYLMYSIISCNINKCAYNMNICCEPVLEHTPSGVYLTVSNCNTLKSKIKFKKYANIGLDKFLKLFLYKDTAHANKNCRVKTYTFHDTCPENISASVLKLAQYAGADNVVDLLVSLTGAQAMRLYEKEYEAALDKSYHLAWSTLITNPQDVKHMDIYDVISGERNKSDIQEKIKQNKRALKISQNTATPELFDVFGNIIM